MLGGARSETLIFFCQSSHHLHVSPTAANQVTSAAGASVFGAGARSGLITERCDNRNIRCFTRLPSDHIQYGHQGQQTFPAVERSLGVFFSLFLDYFS